MGKHATYVIIHARPNYCSLWLLLGELDRCPARARKLTASVIIIKSVYFPLAHLLFPFRSQSPVCKWEIDSSLGLLLHKVSLARLHSQNCNAGKSLLAAFPRVKSSLLVI